MGVLMTIKMRDNAVKRVVTLRSIGFFVLKATLHLYHFYFFVSNKEARRNKMLAALRDCVGISSTSFCFIMLYWQQFSLLISYIHG